MSETVLQCSRRQLLQRMGAGIGVSVLAAKSGAQAIMSAGLGGDGTIALTKDELPKDELPIVITNTGAAYQPRIHAKLCTTPSIETRLFASSNVANNEARNQQALQRVACAGLKVQNPEIVRRQYLRFAGTDTQRASDLQNIATGAIAAPKLLLGVRGGYGAHRLLPMIDWATLGRIMADRGTILAGFSDVTAIQCALLAKGGMSSLAAPMLYSEFGKNNPDQVSCRQFVSALTDPKLTLTINSADVTHPALPPILANQQHPITGTIWGGNLSVVSALAGSPYLPRIKGGIVFLEDVGEQTYRLERMLYDLYLAGVFKDQQAIVFGAFSGTGVDSYDARFAVATVIRQLHQLTALPIYSGMRFGHIAQKVSFPLGATCQITPNTMGGYQLSFTDYPTIAAGAINAEGLWGSATAKQ